MPTYKPEKRKDTDFIEKAQKICKIIRRDVCNCSLQTMGEIMGVNMKNLSAWENGRSNKAEYIFYYYDLLSTQSMKDTFLNLIFKSDGKDVILNVQKDLKNECSNVEITLKQRE